MELVRRTFEAFSAGGVEAVLPLYSPDVIWYPPPEWIEDAVYRGYDGVRRLTAVWTDNFDDFAWELHEIREVQERVLVLAETTGQIKGSGDPIREAFGVVLSDFRDGTIGEVHFFNTWQQAREDVGLEG